MTTTPPSPAQTAIVLSGSGADVSIGTLGVSMALPELVADAGPEAGRQTFEFFTARIPNAHTRLAYGRAVWRFCAWCRSGGLRLEQITPPAIAGYLEGLGATMSVASIKLTASALRNWLGFLTERGVLDANPAASVRTPRLVVREGKTPVLERQEARALFASLDAADAGDVLALRDRAVFAVMLFGFVRVGAVVKMQVRDFEDGDNAWLVLHEKGGRERRIPCHHKTRDYLRTYMQAAGLQPGSRVPLFQSAPRRSRVLTGEPLDRGAVLRIVKRRCKAVGLPSSVCNHSFRATGITIHQENGGDIVEAQKLAGHADLRTTQLYNRKSGKMQRAEVERVQL
jgi:site-specific recombinase XerD